MVLIIYRCYYYSLWRSRRRSEKRYSASNLQCVDIWMQTICLHVAQATTTTVHQCLTPLSAFAAHLRSLHVATFWVAFVLISPLSVSCGLPHIFVFLISSLTGHQCTETVCQCSLRRNHKSVAGFNDAHDERQPLHPETHQPSLRAPMCGSA